MSAGILLRSFSDETVPPYYEHLARIKAGKSLGEWEVLTRWDKALTVALMLVDRAVQGHQAEAEIMQAEKNAKKVV